MLLSCLLRSLRASELLRAESNTRVPDRRTLQNQLPINGTVLIHARAVICEMDQLSHGTSLPPFVFRRPLQRHLFVGIVWFFNHLLWISPQKRLVVRAAGSCCSWSQHLPFSPHRWSQTFAPLPFPLPYSVCLTHLGETRRIVLPHS